MWLLPSLSIEFESSLRSVATVIEKITGNFPEERLNPGNAIIERQIVTWKRENRHGNNRVIRIFQGDVR